MTVTVTVSYVSDVIWKD